MLGCRNYLKEETICRNMVDIGTLLWVVNIFLVLKLVAKPNLQILKILKLRHISDWELTLLVRNWFPFLGLPTFFQFKSEKAFTIKILSVPTKVKHCTVRLQRSSETFTSLRRLHPWSKKMFTSLKIFETFTSLKQKDVYIPETKNKHFFPNQPQSTEIWSKSWKQRSNGQK